MKVCQTINEWLGNHTTGLNSAEKVGLQHWTINEWLVNHRTEILQVAHCCGTARDCNTSKVLHVNGFSKQLCNLKRLLYVWIIILTIFSVQNEILDPHWFKRRTQSCCNVTSLYMPTAYIQYNYDYSIFHSINIWLPTSPEVSTAKLLNSTFHRSGCQHFGDSNIQWI